MVKRPKDFLLGVDPLPPFIFDFEKPLEELLGIKLEPKPQSPERSAAKAHAPTSDFKEFLLGIHELPPFSFDFEKSYEELLGIRPNRAKNEESFEAQCVVLSQAADTNTEMLEATITYDQFGSQTFIASTPQVAKNKRKSASPAVAQGEGIAPPLFAAPRKQAKAPRRSVACMSLIEEEPSSSPESMKTPRESVAPSVSPQEEQPPEVLKEPRPSIAPSLALIEDVAPSMFNLLAENPRKAARRTITLPKNRLEEVPSSSAEPVKTPRRSIAPSVAQVEDVAPSVDIRRSVASQTRRFEEGPSASSETMKAPRKSIAPPVEEVPPSIFGGFTMEEDRSCEPMEIDSSMSATSLRVTMAPAPAEKTVYMEVDEDIETPATGISHLCGALLLKESTAKVCKLDETEAPTTKEESSEDIVAVTLLEEPCEEPESEKVAEGQSESIQSVEDVTLMENVTVIEDATLLIDSINSAEGNSEGGRLPSIAEEPSLKEDVDVPEKKPSVSGAYGFYESDDSVIVAEKSAELLPQEPVADVPQLPKPVAHPFGPRKTLKSFKTPEKEPRRLSDATSINKSIAFSILDTDVDSSGVFGDVSRNESRIPFPAPSDAVKAAPSVLDSGADDKSSCEQKALSPEKPHEKSAKESAALDISEIRSCKEKSFMDTSVVTSHLSMELNHSIATAKGEKLKNAWQARRQKKKAAKEKSVILEEAEEKAADSTAKEPVVTTNTEVPPKVPEADVGGDDDVFVKPKLRRKVDKRKSMAVVDRNKASRNMFSVGSPFVSRSPKKKKQRRTTCATSEKKATVAEAEKEKEVVDKELPATTTTEAPAQVPEADVGGDDEPIPKPKPGKKVDKRKSMAVDRESTPHNMFSVGTPTCSPENKKHRYSETPGGVRRSMRNRVPALRNDLGQRIEYTYDADGNATIKRVTRGSVERRTKRHTVN